MTNEQLHGYVAYLMLVLVLRYSPRTDNRYTTNYLYTSVTYTTLNICIVCRNMDEIMYSHYSKSLDNFQ
jgi:hypothetical protein